MARVLDKLQLKGPLQDWSDETVERVVNAFTDEKFPTVIALNKIDHPDADKVCLPPSFPPLLLFLGWEWLTIM